MREERSLVLVAGSGRSGTSLFSGILKRLGYHVPQPEVPADATNPRGFAESQWVVDFHTKLLARARVQVSDARPAAWAKTAQIALDGDVRGELQAFLSEQFRDHPALIVKDPRLSWFLPLWRACAEEAGAAPRFVTMLRHPAAVIDSKQRWYGGWQGEVGRAAGWVNQMLFTERATREAPRAFVRYDDLLEDWTVALSGAAEALDLTIVRDAPAAALRDVHGFIDRTLSRSRADWEGIKVPAPLRAQADEVWELVCSVAEIQSARPATSAPVEERLDAARAAYVALYEEAEAIAQSSVAAARRTPAAAPVPPARMPVPAARVVRRVPLSWRRRVPLRWRRRVVRVLASR
jgi:hypothetical protein